MAQLIRLFHVTIPAGTLKTSPQTSDFKLGEIEVVRIELVVPPGPRGEVGFKIAQSGVQIIPYSADDYVITDDERIGWDLEGYNTSGAWQMIAYNTGASSHTLEIRFLCNLIRQATALAPAPILNSLLSSPAPVN